MYQSLTRMPMTNPTLTLSRSFKKHRSLSYFGTLNCCRNRNTYCRDLLELRARLRRVKCSSQTYISTLDLCTSIVSYILLFLSHLIHRTYSYLDCTIWIFSTVLISQRNSYRTKDRPTTYFVDVEQKNAENFKEEVGRDLWCHIKGSN